MRLLTALTLCWMLGTSWAATPPHAAIASAHPLATQAGHEILTAGGNAFDAAVAVSAALAVVEPAGSGIGGGGFWLLHRAKDGHEVMLDGRERAPLAAHRDMYLDADGKPTPAASLNGPLAAAIPGTPAALEHLARHYGRLPLSRSLQPAIRLARTGFTIDEPMHRHLAFRLEALRASPAARATLLVNGNAPAVGHRLQQPDLASTLEAMAQHGSQAFYQGEIAGKMVAAVQQAGGVWSLQDLAQYRIVERKPIRAQIGDLRITTAAPPSSGGVALVSILNQLAALSTNARTPMREHLIVEAMRRAYRDRAAYLGDPDFVTIPLARLLSPDYAAGLAASIHPSRATPSAMLAPTTPSTEGDNTTHFSILDREGNRVAATLSLNYPFGSGFIPPGTGVLLNNEMDDFSQKPGSPNGYGLIGNAANAIAPGKRPLSSMTPTFLEGPNGIAILGTPGGSRIITMVLLATLAYQQGLPVGEWVSAPRFHHQYLPDLIEHEANTFSPQTHSTLNASGHQLKPLDRRYGNMQAILWQPNTGHVSAASDPRGIGLAQVCCDEANPGPELKQPLSPAGNNAH